MSEMIERVARAMVPSAYKTFDQARPDRADYRAENKWCNARQTVERARCHAARAIKAMREPTEKMLYASEAFACGQSRDDTIADYTAMIEASLDDRL